MEHNFRTKSLGVTGPNCSQKSGKFFQRTVKFDGGSLWWKPDPWHVQKCIEELGFTVKNLTEAEDSLSEVESRNFQRLVGKMPCHSLDDPTIQFEMAVVMSGMCKQANSLSNGMVDAGDTLRH